MKRVRFKNTHGNSLFEFVVLLFVSSLIVASSVPLWGQSLVRAQIRLESKDLQATLTQARLLALQGGEPVTIVLTRSSYRIEHAQVFQTYTLPDGYSLLSPSEQIVFFPTGVTTPRALEVLFQGLSCRIIISLYGRVRDVCS